MSTRKRQLHLNLSLNGSGHHPAAWRHPDSHPDQLFDLRTYIQLVQQAENAQLDSILFLDRASTRHHSCAAVLGGLESFTLLAALAVHSKHIGLFATASTTYSEPYHIARKLAALDHISSGRAGWHLTAKDSQAESLNYGQPPNQEPATLFRRASEFIDLTHKLFDSWDDDAPVYDKARGIMSDVRKVRAIHYQGEFFSVDGPLNSPRPIQGHPVLAQSHNTVEGQELAAQSAEVVFANQPSRTKAREFYAGLKSLAATRGRESDNLKIFADLPFILGETTTEAEVKAAELEALAEGWNSQFFVGTSAQLVERIEEWFSNRAADGFNLQPALSPGDFEIFSTQVIPELQRRGIFRTAYEGQTLREHLGLRRPINPYTVPIEDEVSTAAEAVAA